MYCAKCGSQNADQARFCTECGESMGSSTAPSQPTSVLPSTQSDRRSAVSGLRTATLVLGLIAATVLLFGGCSAFVAGGIFVGVEEVFETELDEDDHGITSTAEEVSGAGGFAIFVAIFLYIGAGLAKAALKTSLALLVVAMPMLIGLVAVDTTSIFAVFYYLAILLIGTGVVMMAIAYVRSRRARLNPR